MRVLVCGGRHYRDRDQVRNTLSDLDIAERIECVIHGAATGADTEGMIWAQANDRKHAPFAAEWERYGKKAGPLRNQRMLDEGKPDLVVAFPGGRGTANMVAQAQLAGVRVLRVPASPGEAER